MSWRSFLPNQSVTREPGRVLKAGQVFPLTRSLLQKVLFMPTLKAILHPHRANRLVQHHEMKNSDLSFHEVLRQLTTLGWHQEGNSYEAALQRMCDQLILDQIMSLAVDKRAASQTQALSLLAIHNLEAQLQKGNPYSEERKAHFLLALNKINQFKKDPSDWKINPPLEMPAGSPIGSALGCDH